MSWYAKKYNKVIFSVGNLNKEGCRTWESDGKKYMCFWDTVLERYTTCIDPMITYKKGIMNIYNLITIYRTIAYGDRLYWLGCFMHVWNDTTKEKLFELNEKLRKDDKWRAGN